MKKIFSRNLDYIALIATIFLFVIICGYSEAGIKKIPDLPNSAVIQNNDLLVFENQTTNKTNNILFSDLVANFPIPSLTDLSDVNLSSPLLGDVLHFNGTEWVNTSISTIAPIDNIYKNDGTLTGNRALSGDAYSHDLKFSEISFFGVEANEVGIVSNGTYENFAQDFSVTASNATSFLTSTFAIGGISSTAQTDILNYDPISGNVSYIPLSSISPSVQNGLSLISSNVELGGTLLHNTTVDGDVNQYNLWFENLNTFFVSSIESQIVANDNIFFNSGLNTIGEAGNNTSFLSVPDWDVGADLEGTIYSGNDVLNLSGVFGANIRGTGFFNERNSSGVRHYIFAGDTTATGGMANNTTIGMSDFLGESVEISQQLDSIAGNHEYYKAMISNVRQMSYQDQVSFSGGSEIKSFSDGSTGASYNENLDILGSFNRNFSFPNVYFDEYLDNNQYSISYESSSSGFNQSGKLILDGLSRNVLLSNSSNSSNEQSSILLNYNSVEIQATDSSANSNKITVNKDSVSITTLLPEVGGEKIVVRDSSTGELRDSVSVSGLDKKMIHSVTGGSYSANANELIIYQGVGAGAPFTHTITLPSASNGDKVIVKILSSDELQVIPSGIDLIDLTSSYVIDGVGSVNPSITFEYDSSLNSWVVI